MLRVGWDDGKVVESHRNECLGTPGTVHMTSTTCVLCSAPLETAATFSSLTEGGSVSCRRCGKFRMTVEAWEDARSQTGREWISCATRQASEQGHPLTVTNREWDRIVNAHRSSYIRENADKLLDFIARKANRPGKKHGFNVEFDFSVIDATSSAELSWYISYLVEAGLISCVSGVTCELTYKGWDFLVGPASAVAVPGRCFVAMSFQPEHDVIYSDGIEPAVRDAGYEPVILKNVPTNQDINYRILVEIRRSEIVVADFTGQRAGVYFEAGFAAALQREVFWCCRQAEMGEVHFDTNHFQYIDWRDPADLRARLAEKIVAIRGVGRRDQR